MSYKSFNALVNRHLQLTLSSLLAKFQSRQTRLHALTTLEKPYGDQRFRRQAMTQNTVNTTNPTTENLTWDHHTLVCRWYIKTDICQRSFQHPRRTSTEFVDALAIRGDMLWTRSPGGVVEHAGNTTCQSSSHAATNEHDNNFPLQSETSAFRQE